MPSINAINLPNPPPNYQQLVETKRNLAITQAVNSLANQIANGPSSSDVTTLQGDVTTLQGDVVTNTTNITTLQGDVATNATNITTLQGDVTTLQGDMSALDASDLTTGTVPLARLPTIPVSQLGSRQTLVSGYLGSNQSVTAGTWVKVPINTKITDVENAFDFTTNFRYKPAVAGLYLFVATVSAQPTANGYVGVALYKNGSVFFYGPVFVSPTTSTTYCYICAFIDLNGTTDYVELWGYSSGAQINGGFVNTVPQTPFLITRL